MITKQINKIIIGIIIVFITIIINNKSFAANNFKSFDNAPRMKAEVDEAKFADVTAYFTDYSGLKEENINIYYINDEGELINLKNNGALKNGFKVVQRDEKRNRNTQYKCVISDRFLSQETKKFKIEIKDNSGRYFKAYFRIVTYDNNTRYGMDWAPRIKEWKVIDKNTVSFITRDLAGTKVVKVVDLNNNKKEVLKKENLQEVDAEVKINLKNLKQVDGKYFLRIYSTDNAKNKISGYRTVRFAIKDIIESENEGMVQKNASSTGQTPIYSSIQKMAENSLTDILLSSTKMTLNVGKTKTLKAIAEPSTVKATITYTSANKKVATVDKNGVITGKTEGETTITVKSKGNNEIVKTCKVTVENTSKNTATDKISPTASSGDGYNREITLNGRTYKSVGVNGSYGGYQWYGGNNGKTIRDSGCGIAAFMTALTGYPDEVKGSIYDNMISIADFFNPDYPSSGTYFAQYIEKNNIQLKNKVHNDQPANAATYYEEIKEALIKGHTVVINLREATERFGKVYESAENGECSHWCALLGYDETSGNAFCANNCDDDRWYSLEKLANQTYYGWGKESAGPWIEIWKDELNTVSEEKSISFSKLALTLNADSSKTLKAKVKPSNSEVTYKSSNSKIAEVNKDGKITAKIPGTTIISAESNGENATCKVTVKGSIKLNNKTIELQVGKTKKITAATKPLNTKVKWSSSNKKIATVDSGGKVTAKAPGTAKIVAESYGQKAECTVKVKGIIKFKKNEIKIQEGETKKLDITVQPKNLQIKYATSNKKVVQVNSKGEITAIKVGTAVITATNNGVTAKCTIKVTEASFKIPAIGELSKETQAIINAHDTDFDEYNFSKFMQEHGGYGNYVKSLGGVFAKYYNNGNSVRVTTATEFQQVSEYVFGLMMIWGFDYGDLDGNCVPYNSSARFYKSGTIGQHSDGAIDDICSSLTSSKRTCCNPGIDTLLRKCGLFGYLPTGGSCAANVSFADARQAQVGDLVEFNHNNYLSGYGGHVAIVGEVYKEQNTLVLYDTGGWLPQHCNYKRVCTINSDGTLSVPGDGRYHYFARPYELKQE